MGKNTIPLGKVVDALRNELAKLQEKAQAEDLRFRVKEAEVELQVGVTCEGGGEVGFDCWLYKAKAAAKAKRATLQTVRLKLVPVGPPDESGKPTDLEVSSELKERK